jgi:mutator family transposase
MEIASSHCPRLDSSELPDGDAGRGNRGGRLDPGEEQRSEATTPAANFATPASPDIGAFRLNVLIARLDELPAAERHAIGLASVVGEQFCRAAVAAIAPADMSTTCCTNSLDALVRRDLIVPQQLAAADENSLPLRYGVIRDAANGGLPRLLRKKDAGSHALSRAAEDSFRFRHVLIRDAVYNLLTRSERAMLHEQLASWLEESSVDRLDEVDEKVGYHLQQAYRHRIWMGRSTVPLGSLAEHAAAHLSAAGRRALARGDVRRATQLLEDARDLVPVGSIADERISSDRGFPYACRTLRRRRSSGLSAPGESVMGDSPRSRGGTAVKEAVPVAQATRDVAVLPECVQEALGQLAGAAKEGLLALSVGVGLGVLAEMLEEEVDEVVGPKGQRNPDRTAVRHGHDDGEVTLGGRRIEVRRPRVRSADSHSEIQLRTYEHFAEHDPLAHVVLERMLAGVSTRRIRRTQEPVGEIEGVARSTSNNSLSRTLVERTRQALSELMSRQLADLRLAVMMIDGIKLADRMMIVALGITTEGVKIPLGLWEGSTENAAVASALLADLVERGLDPEQGMSFVIDGSQALRKAVQTVLGEVSVQRCIGTKHTT